MRNRMKKIISNAGAPCASLHTSAVTKVNRFDGPLRRSGQRAWPPRSYRCGLIEPSQVVITAALERTTASANEQKLLTPVWFTPIGVATTW
jgi:hypothetical protein